MAKTRFDVKRPAVASKVTHLHKCGLTVHGQLDDYGCGHVWAHHDGSPLKDHYCPVCGCGPFTFRYEEEFV